jgi:hypothetical protein
MLQDCQGVASIIISAASQDSKIFNVALCQDLPRLDKINGELVPAFYFTLLEENQSAKKIRLEWRIVYLIWLLCFP